MRELGFGLLLVAGLALGCGKFGPPIRNLPPEPVPEALPTAEEATPQAVAPEAEAPTETPEAEAPTETPEAAAPTETPAEPSAP